MPTDHAHDPTTARDLLNAAPAGFLSFRDSGEVVAVNDGLLALLGHARDDLVGAHVERIFGVAARIFYQTHLFPLLRMQGHAEEIYLELRSRDGERIPVLLNARREEGGGRADGDSGGEAVCHCVVVRVRERKKYEDELLRAKKEAEAAHAEALAANEAKSHYLRSVSHEIRTPINALLGYADLLELAAGRPMGETELGYITRVRHAARHLLTLVSDILDLAKIESGAMTVDVAPAEIAAAADAALALVEPQARDGGIRLVRERGEGAGEAGAYFGDHERVVQILINLLSNAVKFTDAGGRVAVDWRHVAGPEPGEGAGPGGSGPWLRVRVADTGIGIPADRLEAVFRPFEQVPGSGRPAARGTGLGLAISRELARLMGGDITARSEPGAGSTFSLWLRATEPRPPASASAARASRGPPWPGTRSRGRGRRRGRRG